MLFTVLVSRKGQEKSFTFDCRPNVQETSFQAALRKKAELGYANWCLEETTEPKTKQIKLTGQTK